LGSGSSGSSLLRPDSNRWSPAEKRVAAGEAVTGNGFLLMGDDGDEDAVEKARDRIDNDGIRGLFFL
jgi:hypothetical protein